MLNSKRMLILGLIPLASIASAAALQGISFQHGEWELRCSNTGTCMAAGYQTDDENLSTSILLTRQAGAATTVQAQYMLAAEYGEELDEAKTNNIHFYINNKDLGKLKPSSEVHLTGVLNQIQRNALLAKVGQDVKIEFKNAHYRWQVSDQGMTATLLKMDEFQKRIGTTAALVKKGSANESKVLAAQPAPSIKKVKTSEQPYLSLKSDNAAYRSVYSKLIQALPNKTEEDQDVCSMFRATDEQQDNDYDDKSIELYKLSGGKVLATALCWRGAYNAGIGAWVIDQSLNGKAEFVFESMTDVLSGKLMSAHKGRGLGDCWGGEDWTWDGKRFIQSSDWDSGRCKGVPGGTWHFDKLETVVR